MKKLLILLVLMALLAAGAAYFISRPPSNTEEEFTTLQAEYGTLTEAVSATGTIRPQEIAVVISEIPGVVVDINADIGDHVDKGQQLLKLGDFIAKSKLTQAKAQLASAEDANKTAKDAWEYMKGVDEKVRNEKDYLTTRSTFEQAQRALKTAQEVAKQAQHGVDLTVVRAPIGGTVIDKKVYLGQPVGPVSGSLPAGNPKEAAASLGGAGPLFIIAGDLGKMQVHAQVMEGDIAKIRPGLEATFTVYAYSDGNEPLAGKVVQRRPLATGLQGAVFFDTVIDVKNRRDPKSKEWMLLPGMTASVDIILRKHQQVWKIPTQALSFQLDEHYQTEAAKRKIKEWQERKDANQWEHVWIMKDKKPWPIFVRTGGVKKYSNGVEETGITDVNGQFKEVLDWDPDFPQNRPEVIIGAPPAHKPGLFDLPTTTKFRLS